MRDLRELWERDGWSGLIGLGLLFYWTLHCEYAIVRHGLRVLSALL